MDSQMADARREVAELRDELVAREEIEAYYTGQVDEAWNALLAAQKRHAEVSRHASQSLRALTSGSGERLDGHDVAWIAIHAGGRAAVSDEVFKQADLFTPGRAATDDERARIAELREAQQNAAARNAATVRWLVKQGYDVPGPAD